jgi:hypothetical protein
MVRLSFLVLFLIFISSCSGRKNSGSAIQRMNLKEAQKIQKENYKNYTNSYNYKMQLEVERRHKDELRRSKFAHKNKAQ